MVWERHVPEHIDAGNQRRGRHVARCVFQIEVATEGGRTGDIGRRGDIEAREGVDRVDQRRAIAPCDVATPEVEVGTRRGEPVPGHEAARQFVDRSGVERRVAEREPARRAVTDKADRRHARIGGKCCRHVGEQIGGRRLKQDPRITAERRGDAAVGGQRRIDHDEPGGGGVRPHTVLIAPRHHGQ